MIKVMVLKVMGKSWWLVFPKFPKFPNALHSQANFADLYKSKNKNVIALHQAQISHHEAS